MKKVIAITALAFFLFYPLFPSPETSVQETIVVQVDGYAQLSEEKSIGDSRRLAFANARRLALENVLCYVKSKTTVENFVVSHDLIESMAEGVVEVIEMKDYGIEENSRYHVWINAEITAQDINKLLKKDKSSIFQLLKDKDEVREYMERVKYSLEDLRYSLLDRL